MNPPQNSHWNAPFFSIRFKVFFILEMMNHSVLFTIFIFSFLVRAGMIAYILSIIFVVFIKFFLKDIASNVINVHQVRNLKAKTTVELMNSLTQPNKFQLTVIVMNPLHLAHFASKLLSKDLEVLSVSCVSC